MIVRKNEEGLYEIDWKKAEHSLEFDPPATKPYNKEKRRELHRKAKAKAREAAMESNTDPEDDIGASDGGAGGLLFLDEKRKYSAKNEELKYRKQLHELVEADVVRQESFEAARLTRDALLAIPDRLAGELAGTGSQDECYDILTNEISRILTDLSDRVGRLEFKDRINNDDGEG
jgi:hypothetical protein